MKRIVLLFILLLQCSCATKMAMKEDFDSGAKGFNRMIRWQEPESAGIMFMDASVKASYLDAVAVMKKKGVSIADFRILSKECNPETGTGEVLAEFDYYTLPSNRVKTISYKQKWVYRDTDDVKGWKVLTPLPEFE